MRARKIIGIGFLLVSSTTPELARQSPSTLQTARPDSVDFSRVVFPITQLDLKPFGVSVTAGTGFCLDIDCRFVVTNYHVEMMAHPHKIHGQKILARYLATGPDDEDATVNRGRSGNLMTYTLRRDLAVYELRRGLSHYRGAGFSLDDLDIGQKVEIYAFPMYRGNPIRGLERFSGTYKGHTATGLLAFDYVFSSGKRLRPGASGGIIVNSDTHMIVGVLAAIGWQDESTALAVPVQPLSDLVRKVQPCLAQKLFRPSNEFIPPELGDLYPKIQAFRPEIALQHRPLEAIEVQQLRAKAQQLADGMTDFIAVQTFAWGKGHKPPAAEAAYEVRVLDGNQRFREYPNGKKELKDEPEPPTERSIGTGDGWAQMPQMIGTELGFKIYRAADREIEGKRIRVFQYEAGQEDGACRFKTINDFVLFVVSKIDSVGCYGEVWTDEDVNILRISLHLELRGKWKNYESVVTYGWLRDTQGNARLIPVTIAAQADYDNKTYWCRGQFMNYRVFASRVRVAAE